MGAREPAIAVKFVMIKTQLADKLRILRTAAFHSRADVENDQAIVPVSEICQTIFNLKIVNIASGDVVAFLRA